MRKVKFKISEVSRVGLVCLTICPVCSGYHLKVFKSFVVLGILLHQGTCTLQLRHVYVVKILSFKFEEKNKYIEMVVFKSSFGL